MQCKKCKKEIPDESSFCNHCGSQQVKKRSRRVRANGEGTAYQLKNGKWRAEITIGRADGKRISKTKSGFKTKKDALAYIPTLKNEKSSQHVTIKYLYDEWSVSTHFTELSKSRKTTYRSAYNKLKPLWLRTLRDLRIEELQATIDAVEGYYPRHDMKQLLSLLYDIAEINGDVDKNISKFIRLPKLIEKEKEAFDEKEILAIWADYNAGYTFSGYLLLMIYAGMGPGELQNTYKHMINWEEQTIVGAGVKTRKGKQWPIIIADDLLPVLRELCKLSVRSEKLLPMGETKFRKIYKEAIQRMGIRHLAPYCCRHTCATALALAGVEATIIRAIMRHTKYQTTLRYTHIQVRPLVDGVNKLPQNKTIEMQEQ